MPAHCPTCGQATNGLITTPPTNVRIRAYVLSTSEKAALDMLRLPDQHALIKSMFKHTQVYTHVDVYSPPPDEDLLFRVNL